MTMPGIGGDEYRDLRWPGLSQKVIEDKNNKVYAIYIARATLNDEYKETTPVKIGKSECLNVMFRLRDQAIGETRLLSVIEFVGNIRIAEKLCHAYMRAAGRHRIGKQGQKEQYEMLDSEIQYFTNELVQVLLQEGITINDVKTFENWNTSNQLAVA